MKKNIIIVTIIIITVFSIPLICVYKSTHINIKPYDNSTFCPEEVFYQEIKKYPSYSEELKEKYYEAYKTIETTDKDLHYIRTLNTVNYPDFLKGTNDTLGAPTINNIILVNRRFSLSKNYVPSELVTVEGVNFVKRPNEELKLNKTVLKKYKELLEEATKSDVSLLLYSGYRSYEKQMLLFQNSNFDVNNPYLAIPGHSEHQTGLAIDVATKDSGLTDNFKNTASFTFLKENAHKYGFIIRYPEAKTDITGYNEEPWHLRYVGDIATFITEQNLTLEEYLYYYCELSF